MKIFDIKLVDSTTIDEQIAVFVDAFHIQTDFKIVKEQWIKKHFENPNGNSYIFAAYDGKEMVGMNAFMPLKYKHNDVVLNIVQSCESGVRIAYRRNGIWKKIMNAAMEYFKKENLFDVMIGFPNYFNSYPGFINLGWEYVCNMSNFLMIVHGGKTVSALLDSNRLSVLWKTLEIQKFVSRIRKKGFAGYLVKREEIDAIEFNNISKEDTFSLYLSSKWLCWKASYKQLELYSVSSGGKKYAYFIIGRKCLRTVEYYEIERCMYLYNNKEINIKIFCVFLEYLFSKKDCNFIRVWNQMEGLDKYILRRSGFFQSRRHKNPFIIYVLKENYCKRESFVNSQFWDLTFLDLD